MLYTLGTVDFELLGAVLITDNFYVSYKYPLLTIFEEHIPS